MLETIRGVGTFVRSRSPISPVLTEFMTDYGLDQILIYRRALEIEAAQLAAVNRSDDQLAALRASYEYDLGAAPGSPRTVERGTTPGPFHHLLFEAAGTPLLTAMYSGVMAAIRTAMSRQEIVYGTSHDLRHHDHLALLEAISDQDVTQAAHSMALHVDRDLVPDDGSSSMPSATQRMQVLLERTSGVRR